MESLLQNLMRMSTNATDNPLRRMNLGTIMSRGVKKHITTTVRKMVEDTVLGTIEMLEKMDKNVLSDVSTLIITCKFSMDGSPRPHDHVEVGYCCRISNWDDEELFVSGFILLSIKTEDGREIWKNPDPESGLYFRYLRMEFIYYEQLSEEIDNEKKRLKDEFAALPANLTLREGLVLNTAASTAEADVLNDVAVLRFAKAQMEWAKDLICVPHLGDLNLENTDPRVVMVERETTAGSEEKSDNTSDTTAAATK